MTVAGDVLPSAGEGESSTASSKTWMELTLLSGAVLLAAFLRFAFIGAKSLWFDEAYSAFLAGRPPRELLALVASWDTHPPLYYLALSFWTRVFGTSEAALRSLGAVFSTLVVPGTWWLGRRLGGPKVGVLAAVLTAIAPLQVIAGQEARMYPLLELLTLVSWAALLVAVDGNRGAWAVYVAATVLALYTHYFAFLTVAGQGVFMLVAAPRSRQPWLICQLIIVVFYLPWLATLFATAASGRGWPFYRPPIGLNSLTALFGLLSFGGHGFGFEGYFGGTTAPVTAQLLMLAPFIFVIGIGAAAVWKRPRSMWLLFGYFVVPVGLAFVFSLWHNIFYPRYFSYVFPAFVVLLARGIVGVSEWFTPSARRMVLAGLLVLVLGMNGVVLSEVLTDPRYSLFRWRDAAALLSARAGPDDLIVAFPGFGQTPLTYYFKGPQRIEPMTSREFYEGTGGALPPDPALAARNRAVLQSYAVRHRVMWLVTTRPLPPAALERLRGLLVGIYDFRDVADFNGVLVFRLTRHPGWEGTR